jgi:hypothetical protein
MIGDPVPHVRSLLAAIYHGACWVPARPPVSPSLPLARVIWPVFTTTLRPASVVAAAERNERADLGNGRTSGASPQALSRAFFFFFFLGCGPEPGAPNTWRGGTGRAISLRSGGGPRGPRGAEQGAARVTCPFVRQPAEHVDGCCGGGAEAATAEVDPPLGWWKCGIVAVAPVASVPCSFGRKKWLPLFE